MQCTNKLYIQSWHGCVCAAVSYTNKRCYTWMSASGFSRLRISAASCCFSSSTMEARDERGGLPTAPITQGLRGEMGDAMRERTGGWLRCDCCQESVLVADRIVSLVSLDSTFPISLPHGEDSVRITELLFDC